MVFSKLSGRGSATRRCQISQDGGVTKQITFRRVSPRALEFTSGQNPSPRRHLINSAHVSVITVEKAVCLQNRIETRFIPTVKTKQLARLIDTVQDVWQMTFSLMPLYLYTSSAKELDDLELSFFLYSTIEIMDNENK